MRRRDTADGLRGKSRGTCGSAASVSRKEFNRGGQVIDGRVGKIEHAHVLAAGDELFNEVAADKPGPAGDEDGRRWESRTFHAAAPWPARFPSRSSTNPS